MKNVIDSIDKYNKKKNLETELYKAFNESYSNDKFKRLVDKLKLNIEVLSKYTSELEESSIEYDHCLNCKGLIECKNKICGYAYLPNKKDKSLSFGYKACKFKNKYEKENSYKDNVYVYNEPKEIANARIKDIYKKDASRYPVITYLMDFLEKYLNGEKVKGIYLSGSFGSGKTYLVSAVFNELAKNNIKSSIVYWPEYISYLKTLFGKEEYITVLNKVKKIPILLIDDIGAEANTSWERDEVLGPILQYRMQDELPTFFTSNLDINMLEQHLSNSKDGIEEIKAKRIIERVRQLTNEFNLVTKNYRK